MAIGRIPFERAVGMHLMIWTLCLLAEPGFCLQSLHQAGAVYGRDQVGGSITIFPGQDRTVLASGW